MLLIIKNLFFSFYSGSSKRKSSAKAKKSSPTSAQFTKQPRLLTGVHKGNSLLMLDCVIFVISAADGNHRTEWHSTFGTFFCKRKFFETRCFCAIALVVKVSVWLSVFVV